VSVSAKSSCFLDVDDILDVKKGAICKLWAVCIICFVFMIAEIVGGIWAGSLAILTDAAHLGSDVSGFLISIMSIYIAQRQATSTMNYGWHRAEIIGALASVLIIWGLTIWLIQEAVKRIVNPQPIEGLIMLITAIGGLLCNIIMALVLQGGDGTEPPRAKKKENEGEQEPKKKRKKPEPKKGKGD